MAKELTPREKFDAVLAKGPTPLEKSNAVDEYNRMKPGPKAGHWLPNTSARHEAWRKPDGTLISLKMPVNPDPKEQSPLYVARVAALEKKGLKRG